MCFRFHELGYPKNQIVSSNPDIGILYTIRGKKYFDVFEPEKDEVFIDCGCWGEDTIERFVELSGEQYRKIYAFEPLEEQIAEINRRIETNGWKNVEVINAAIWKKANILKLFEKSRRH